MIKLTEKAFFLDFEHGKICEGVVVGVCINESGFEVVAFKTEDNHFPVVHKRFVFKNKEDAEKALSELKPLNDEIKKIKEDATKKTDDLLAKLCGTPDYTHLTVKYAQQQTEKSL